MAPTPCSRGDGARIRALVHTFCDGVGLHAYCIRGSPFRPTELAVTKRIPQPRSELSPSIRTHEAKLLAAMLRTSRLTCVFGEPGTDKTTLLKTGVMPLLQRRCADRSDLSTATVSSYPGADRRGPAHGGQPSRRVEAAIYFDTWGETPLATLKSRIDDIVPASARGNPVLGLRLADALEQLNRQSGLHIVFLLDRFEEFLAAPGDEAGAAHFVAELTDAVLRPKLPASFLIALDESARPRLERFKRRVPGFDHNSLRLSPIAGLSEFSEPWPGPIAHTAPAAPVASVLPVLTSEIPDFGRPAPTSSTASPQTQPGEAQVARVKRRGPAPHVPIKVSEVYAFIETALAKTKTRDPDDAWKS